MNRLLGGQPHKFRHVQTPGENHLLKTALFDLGKEAEATRSFQQAIAKDAGYALPYAGLADVYVTLAYHGVMGREEAIEKSKAAVQKALELAGGAQ